MASTAMGLDDLTPPTFNWKRDSILFSENPATQRTTRQMPLHLWNWSKSKLPPIITGAWPWRDVDAAANQNPMGALYNIVFVRLPIIIIGITFGINELQGHPLILDFGHGPFAMNPLFVFVVLAFILA